MKSSNVLLIDNVFTIVLQVQCTLFQMNIQVDEFAGDCIENSNNDSQDSSNPKFLSAQEISKLDPFR